MVLGKVVANRWRGSTYAVSDGKAKSNLSYKYKKQHKLMPTAKVELPGELVMAKEDV
jgi:hypothetical protein